MAHEVPALPDAARLLDEMPCGMLVTDAHDNILKVNQTFCVWSGYANEELVGHKKLQELLTVGGRIFHQTHWQPMLQMQGSVSEVKFDLLLKDGKRVTTLFNAVRQAGGLYDVITVTVAEERNKYERQLLLERKRADALAQKENDRASFAEQMVGIVSHDLRNPLSAILMGSLLMQRLEELPPKLARLVQNNISSTHRAKKLIDDLLDFTLARVGKGVHVTLTTVDLHDIVRRSIDELALAFPGCALQHVTIGTGSCTADADRIAQLLGNLVANAASYGLPGSPIVIASTLASAQATISVHNWGEPIPPALLPTLFEAMVRGDAADRATRSVGLGLFIVRAVAEALHGEVAVTSTLEEGTTFSVSFPRTTTQTSVELLGIGL